MFGDKGMIVHGSHGGGGCRLLPEKLMDQYSGKNAPAEKIARVKGHAWDWIEAIRTGRQAGSNFGYGGPLTQDGPARRDRHAFPRPNTPVGRQGHALHQSRSSQRPTSIPLSRRLETLIPMTPLLRFIALCLVAGSLSAQDWRPVPGHIMTPGPTRWIPGPRSLNIRAPRWCGRIGSTSTGFGNTPSSRWNCRTAKLPGQDPGALPRRVRVVRREAAADTAGTSLVSPHVPSAPAGGGKRLLLHFGAVDWEAKVFVNGKPVGEHRGGYDAFTFDITEAVETRRGKRTGRRGVRRHRRRAGHRQAELQQDSPSPAASPTRPARGIWQTVWLETVPASHIERLEDHPGR